MKIPNAVLTAACAILVLAVSTPSTSFAQETTTTTASGASAKSTNDNEKEVVLDPFIVSTAQDKGYYSEQTTIGARYNKNINDLPASVVVVNKQLLDDLGAVNMLDPTKYAVSGVTPNQPHGDDFNIRGFRSRGALRNGLESGFGGFESSTWDVERLEVIKGPVSMLTGINTSAIGGVVNYISARPTENYDTYLNLSGADKNELRIKAQSSGPITKFDDTKLLYRVTYGKWDRQFDIPNEYQHENFLGGSFQAKFGARSSFLLEYSALDKDFNDNNADSLVDPVAYAAGRLVPRAGTENFAVNGPGSFEHVNTRLIFSEFTHSFPKYLALHLAYQNTLEYNDGNFILIDSYLPTDNTMVSRNSYQSKLQGETNHVQLDLVNTVNIGPAKSELSGGLDYVVSDTRQLDFQYFPLDPISIYHPDYSKDAAAIQNQRINGPFPYETEKTRRDADSYSYYVQENLGFWKDRLIVVGGWRWIDSYTNTQTVVTGKYVESNPPPIMVYKHGAILKPLPNISLYATKGTNFFPSTGAIANQGTPYQFVRPDSNGEQVEYGLKFNFLNGKLYGEVAHFNLRRTNVRSSQVVTYPDGTVHTIEAALDTTSIGSEADLGGRFDVPDGKLDITLSLYDARSLTPHNVPAYNAPTYMSSVILKYAIERGILKGLSIGGAVHRESGAYMSAAVVVHRPMVGTFFTSYRYDRHWMAALNVDNVSDAYYFVAGGPTSGTLAERRKVRLSLQYNY